MPHLEQGVYGASRLPGPGTTACTMEAVWPLAQVVTSTVAQGYVYVGSHIDSRLWPGMYKLGN